MRNEPPPALGTLPAELLEPRGCFVTVRVAGELRGCLGRLTAVRPLGESVAKLAAEAAIDDPRFSATPLRVEDLRLLEIEVSLLSPLVHVANPARDVVAGVHGVYVVREEKSGVFLPKVAIEQAWTAAELLDEVCALKAGLPRGAWREPQTRIYVFTAEVLAAAWPSPGVGA